MIEFMVILVLASGAFGAFLGWAGMKAWLRHHPPRRPGA